MQPRFARLSALALSIAWGGPALAAPRPSEAQRSTGGNVVVENCDDSGPRSLRASVDSAFSGDTVDLSALTCSSITLTSGPVIVPQDYLTLIGPGAAELTISPGGYDSANVDGLIVHDPLTQHNQIAVSRLTLSNGFNRGALRPQGGCLSSPGNVVLDHAAVSGCSVILTDLSEIAIGGGVAAGGDLTLISSAVTGNIAANVGGGSTYGPAKGGGVYVAGAARILYSTLSYNAVFHGVGGGIDAGGRGDNYLSNSLIAQNYAREAGALILETAQGYPSTLTVVNSTISGNRAWNAGGVLSIDRPVVFWNSTVVFNTSYVFWPAGLYAYAADLHSSMVADNVYLLGGNNPYDLFAGSVTGEANLITGAASTVLPPDTLTDCPVLDPRLANNGGPTKTHALAPTSPGFDVGSNNFGTAGLSHDQRGSGFPRAFGAGADIGAFEWQGEAIDFVFSGAFENRCQ